ncbi:MAG: hypothetical protein KF745_10800 [Phycisphaeraceae bacterium]|nr:hypothetical protein [Phycisphaeraceae bacterium]
MLTFKADGGTFWCSAADWLMMVRLAKSRGWNPSGIPQPIEEDGSPDYSPDAWSYSKPGLTLKVPDEDARALADSLESSLPDLPRFDALEDKSVSRLDMPGQLPVRMMRPGATVSPFEYFSGINRIALERFIALCRSGGLTVR